MILLFIRPLKEKEKWKEDRKKVGESGGESGGGKTFLLSIPSTLSFFSFMNPWVGEEGGGIFEW